MATGARTTVASARHIHLAAAGKTAGTRHQLDDVGRAAGRASDARGFPVERRQLVKPRIALPAVKIVYWHLFCKFTSLQVYKSGLATSLTCDLRLIR